MIARVTTRLTPNRMSNVVEGYALLEPATLLVVRISDPAREVRIFKVTGTETMRQTGLEPSYPRKRPFHIGERASLTSRLLRLDSNQ